VRFLFEKWLNMNQQPLIINQEQEQKKTEGFKDFSDRMTTGLAYASGGAALGMVLCGRIGGTVGAIITGSAGLIFGGHHKSPHGH